MRRQGATALAVIGIASLAAAQLWPGLGANLSPPISWDHGVHLGKPIVTVEELLPWLRGWTDRYEVGLPLNTLYGIGGVIWVLLFRVLTFGALTWEQTYAIAVLAARVCIGLAAFRLARASGAGVAGAFAAGVMALADHGDHSEGGWFYDVLYGVWPVSLAMALTFLAWSDVLEIVQGEGSLVRFRGKAVRAACLFGFALLTHQLAMIAVASLWLLLAPMLKLERGRSLRLLVSPAVIAALGIALSAFWLVPMLARSDWFDTYGQLYISSERVGTNLALGTLIHRSGPYTSVLVAIAVVVALFSSGYRRYLAFSALALWLVSTSTFFSVLEALGLTDVAGRITYPRFMMIVKPMCFALVGYLVHDLVRAVAPALRRSFSSARGIVAFVAALALLSPFAPGILQGLKEQLIDREVTYTATRPGWSDWLAMTAWLRAQPRQPFFRVAGYDASSHIFMALPAYAGLPGHKLTHPIGDPFRGADSTDHPEALRMMNVRYVVSWGPMPGHLAHATRPVREFGAIQVRELVGWTSEVAFDPSGEARPRVRNLERARVVVEPRGARSIVVRRAMMLGWTATIDGREVSIDTVPVVDAPRVLLMRIDVPEGAREVALEYHAWRLSDVLGLLLTLLGIAATALVLSPPARLRARLRRAAERVTADRRRVRIAWGAAIAVGVLAAIVAIARFYGKYDIERATDALRVELEEQDGTVRACAARAHDGGHYCGPHDWQHVSLTTMPIGNQFRRCLWAHPTAGAVLRITHADVDLPGRLRVGAGISQHVGARGHGAPIRVRVLAGGRAVADLEYPNASYWTEHEVELPEGARELTLEIRSDESSRRELCLGAREP